MKLEQFYYLTNKLIDQYSLLHFLHGININSFLIILDTRNLSNNNILDLKTELLKYGSNSLVLKAQYIEILFSNHFEFMKASCLFIFANDIIQFKNVIKLFNNTLFFYSFNKCFSNITNFHMVLYQQQLYENYLIVHYIIFKLINNITLILLLYIMLFIKLASNMEK